jgi:Ni,Fe-hydrogenase III small subunit/ferredoxin
MLRTLIARAKQGYKTISFPVQEGSLPQRFRGLPQIDDAICQGDCRKCLESCPTGALHHSGKRITVDLGKCLFCQDCVENCPQGAIRYTQKYQMAARKRGELILRNPHLPQVVALEEKRRRLFRKSLKLRQVSAGGCNGCELDINVLSTVVFDLGRYGIQFVASPRHADGLLITGPVTENMRLALQKTYEAVAEPKLVIAVGACAISGGPYIDHAEAHNGAESIVPVDLYIPGCPPHPLTILDGLLQLLGRK